MKENQVFLIKIVSWVFLIATFFFGLKNTFSTLKANVKLNEEFNQLNDVLSFKESEKIFIKNLPEGTLRIVVKMESHKIPPFHLEWAVHKNSIFFQIPFGIQKIELEKKSLEDLKELVRNLQKAQIFQKFEKRNHEAEFLIDKKRLQNAILEWKNDEKLKENLLTLNDIEGKIFYNEKEEIQKIEIKAEDGKIVIEFKNIREKTGEENLENFILSFLK